MEDIHFNCPHCSERLSSPPEGAGVEINCPTCQTVIVIPAESPGLSKVHAEERGLTSPSSLPLPPPPPEFNGPAHPTSETERDAPVSRPGPMDPASLPPPPPPVLGHLAPAGDSAEGYESPRRQAEKTEGESGLRAPAGVIPGEQVFEEAQQWGTVCDSFSPENIYHGTQVRGDISFPIRITVSDNGVELHLRQVTPNELKSFLTGNLPWLAGMLLAPFQCLLGLCLTPILLVCSILAPWYIPLVLWDGLLYFIGIFTSTINLIRFLAEYGKAMLAYIKKTPYTFYPRGVELEEGQLARFTAGQPLQLVRVDVSESLLKRVVKRARKAEEEDMGLIGLIIGFGRLLLLPLRVFLRIGEMTFRMIGVKPAPLAMFALVEGLPVDLEAPVGIVSRWKKRREEKNAQKQRTLYLVRAPQLVAARLQQAMEATLHLQAALVDDALAKKTIWRDLV